MKSSIVNVHAVRKRLIHGVIAVLGSLLVVVQADAQLCAPLQNNEWRQIPQSAGVVPTFTVPDTNYGRLTFQLSHVVEYDTIGRRTYTNFFAPWLVADISPSCRYPSLSSPEYAQNLVLEGLSDMVIQNPPPGTYHLWAAESLVLNNGWVINSYLIRAILLPRAPTITAQPQSRSVCVGNSVSFAVSASGQILAYQWFKGGTAIGGANGPAYTISNAQQSDAGNYFVQVSNAGGSVNSSTANLVVLAPPTITLHPQSQTVAVGRSVTFTLSVTGQNLAYQWYRNNSAISNATAATFTISSVKQIDAGSYHVQVSNGCGQPQNSLAASLAVVVPPAITVQPADVSIGLGAIASFGVTATGSSPLSYQWYFNNVALGGQTASSLTLNNVQVGNAGAYSVKVSNAAGEVTSRNAILSVQTPPTVTIPPKPYAAAEGEDVTFTVLATGATPLSYQWNSQSASGGPYIALPGGNGTSLRLASVTAANAGYYTVAIQNSIGAVTTTPVQLTVAPEPKITAQPQSKAVPPGTNVTFSVTALGRQPLFYQWYLGDTPIPHATNATLTLSNVTLSASGGFYTVAISNAWGSVQSQSAHLRVSGTLASVGTLLWSLDIPSDSPPAFGPDGTLYLSAGSVRAISPSGQIKWSQPGASKIGAVASDGKIYTLGPLRALDPSGNIVWTSSQGANQIALRSDRSLVHFSGLEFGGVAEDDTVYRGQGGYPAGCQDLGQWQVFNPDGSFYWELRYSNYQPGTTFILTADGKLIFPIGPIILSNCTWYDHRLWARNASGTHRWESRAITDPNVQLAIGPNEMILCGTYGGVVALDRDGVFLWRATPTDVAPLDRAPTPAAAADGTIYFTARFGLFAYDQYGAFQWQFSTRENIRSAPTIGPDGTVYFSTTSRFYAVKGSAPLAATSWPVEGANPRRTFRSVRPPAFTLTPQLASAEYGGSASFAAAATGPPPIAFQWRFRGTNLPGATNATLTLNYLSTEDAGEYEVDAINLDTGLLVRTNVHLTVGPPSPGPPFVSIQPQSQRVVVGSPVQFGARAIGAGPLSYQWLKDNVPIPSETNSSYAVTDTQDGDAGAYTVIASNPFGSVPSAVANLTVLRPATVDAFDPAYNGYLLGPVVVLPDGKVLVGGGDSDYAFLDWLNADGSRWARFDRGERGEDGTLLGVNSLAVQPDGGTLGAGNYFKQGVTYSLWRFHPFGFLDTAFNLKVRSAVRGRVWCITVQPDGKILVGGDFTFTSLGFGANIVRLHADGSLDEQFNPGARHEISFVTCLAVQADGKVLVGGYFTNFGGQLRTNMARVNGDGSLDNNFAPTVGGSVLCWALQPDGKILVGGSFTNLSGYVCTNMGRLNPDGTFDTGFNARIGGGWDIPVVSTLALQADGGILVGGRFTTLGGQARSGIGRLRPDGTLDSLFNPVADGGVMYLAVQPDGKVLARGEFTNLNGQPRFYLGRLNNTEPATQRLLFDGTAITWLRGGTSPDVWATAFDFTTNGLSWASLGTGTRIEGGWRLQGVSLPERCSLRARGFVSGGGTTSWLVENIVEISPQIRPAILANGSSSNGFGFQFIGGADQITVVEASTNLMDWVPVHTVLPGTEPALFADPDAILDRRFYRVKFLAP